MSNEMQRLHDEAMEAAQAAVLARGKGDAAASLEAFRQAFEKEAAAASLTRDSDVEPTRSVLHRSAAALAIECRRYREAEKLIAVALSGDPPEGTCDELRDLLEQVYFERHLEVRGETLAPNEFQMSLFGKDVGLAIAPSKAYLARVDNVDRMVLRTAERITGVPYRDRRRRTNELLARFSVYISLPRAASFAVTFRVGGPSEQLLLDFPDTDRPPSPDDVVEEMVACLRLYAEQQEEELERRIEDAAYFRNFRSLADSLSPDGKSMLQVGFTAARGDTIEKIVLPSRQRQPRQVRPRRDGTESEQRAIEVRGTLRYADAMQSQDTIRVTDTEGRAHTIRVPEGMLSDIVKPLWEETVFIVARQAGQDLILVDISPSDE